MRFQSAQIRWFFIVPIRVEGAAIGVLRGSFRLRHLTSEATELRFTTSPVATDPGHGVMNRVGMFSVARSSAGDR